MANHDYPYVYSSSELGKYFGISIKGIEYYEKKGLIKPQRVGHNKQRRFDLMETYRIWMTRYLRQSGFNVDQTRTVLDADQPAVAEASFDDLLTDLKAQRAKLDATIAVLQRHMALLGQLADGPFFEETVSPAAKWLFLRSMEAAHESNAHQSREYRQWNELMPITDASVRYQQAAIVSGAPDLAPEIGMIITNAQFRRCGLTTSVRVRDLPPQRCLHTILVGDSQQIKRRQWLQPALAELKRRHLKLNGDVVTALLLVLDNDQAHIRFDEAWLPVTAAD